MTVTTLSRTLKAIGPTGEEFDLAISIGIPYQEQDRGWACIVQITRMFEPARPFSGVDPWPAVQLSYQFIANELNSFLASGGRLFWQGTDKALAIGDFIPKLRSRTDETPAA